MSCLIQRIGKYTVTEIYIYRNIQETCHFEKDMKDIVFMSYNVKTKSKGKKNVVVLSTSRLLHRKTIDDDKEKPQIIKFYDFTKGGTGTIDQLNNYYTVSH